MISRATRKKLKSLFPPKLYRTLRVLSRIPISLFACIRCDLLNGRSRHFLRETASRLFHGTVYLGPEHYRFYRNVVENVIQPETIVFDVGANDGWFAKILDRFGKSKRLRIISYEPLQSQQEDLLACKQVIPRYSYEQCALSSKVGEMVIHEYATSGLSSLKDLEPTAYDNAIYDTTLVAEYPVEVRTLDDEIRRLGIDDTSRIAVKIDVQGLELEVLQSAASTLARSNTYCIVIELMNKKKYENQALSREIMCYLFERGYIIHDL